ncbi:hypothetical protein [Cronobacter phage JC01]|uniref:Uncharacterized protein n=1 Tax=Cronobacter phage JC01 TaxID=2729575 RepID=A0A6M3YL29_9CAUD|nr:hypothetical protein JT331_gp45 [Cronobacter phage JC01]QJI52272.1 hypothetical protein [Cronobacter phage JC01]
MFSAAQIRRFNYVEQLKRRHMLFALAYKEAKRAYREMSYHDMPVLEVPFKPVHYYMHLLPGFNTHFVPAKYLGWRRLRAVDVGSAPDKEGFVRFSINADWVAKQK